MADLTERLRNAARDRYRGESTEALVDPMACMLEGADEIETLRRKLSTREEDYGRVLELWKAEQRLRIDLESRLDLYQKAIADARQAIEIMEGTSISGEMNSLGMPPEHVAVFDAPCTAEGAPE